MTWSAADALDARKNALRLLLDHTNGKFTRSLEWFEPDGSGIPQGVWSLLLAEDLVKCHVVGGIKWRITLDGWIEACRLLRDEVNLDRRFGELSRHLKALADHRKDLYTTFPVQTVAAETKLDEDWIRDAIEGRMAERIFGQDGATIEQMSGYIDIPAHICNKPPTSR